MKTVASSFADSEEDTNEKGIKYRSFILSWLRQYYITLGVAVLVLIGAVLLLVVSSNANPVIVTTDIPTTASGKNLREQLFDIQTGSLAIPDKKPVEQVETKGVQKAPWEGCEYSLPDPDTRKHIVEPPIGPITLVCCNTTKVILSTMFALLFGYSFY
jgi:hypothetical protein